MALLGKIISALIAALPAVLDWWRQRQTARNQAEAEARLAAIRSDPAAAWLRKFGGKQPGAGDDNASDTPAPGEPDRHQ